MSVVISKWEKTALKKELSISFMEMKYIYIVVWSSLQATANSNLNEWNLLDTFIIPNRKPLTNFAKKEKNKKN